MDSYLSNLNEQEQRHLIETPALIAILIAGADNNIDEAEKDWAEKVTHFRSMKNDSILSGYYYEVDKVFIDTFNDYLSSLPKEAIERNKVISAELTKVNDIFPKLESGFAKELYDSFLTYADQVARASGGVLGFAAVSTEEKEWAQLSMIKKPY
jgi:hypothetical protein